MTEQHTHATIGRDQRSIYLTILNEQIEIRKREHGKAYVTPGEEAWLRAHGLQPAHRYTILRTRSDHAPARAWTGRTN